MQQHQKQVRKAELDIDDKPITCKIGVFDNH